MQRRKQTKRMTVQDIRTILRLTHEQGLSVREIGLRLKLSKTTVATYLLRTGKRVSTSGPCRPAATMMPRWKLRCSSGSGVRLAMFPNLTGPRSPPI